MVASSRIPDVGPIDYEQLAIELIRALRGRRSQAGFSRRIGARSNVVHRWESGVSMPTAARFLEVCAALGTDVRASYARLLPELPGVLGGAQPASTATVAAFLNALRGKTPIIALAANAGVNRYTCARWLKGSAQPSLPQFLHLIEAASHRLLDFVATLAEPHKLPTIAPAFAQLEHVRHLAYDEPWSHAVLRALQLQAAPGLRDEAWIARRIGLPLAAVKRLVRVLLQAGQVRRGRGGLRAAPLQRVDTTADPARSRGLKLAWTQVALERLQAGAPGTFGFSVFEVSKADLERVRALQLDYLRAMQAIMASSQRTDCVALYCAQLIDLADGSA